MNLLQAIKAANEAGSILSRNHTFLIYGEPKTGKTRLVATIIRIKELKRIFWFDTENGIETILTMYREGLFTNEEMEKVILIRIPDTREQPTAIETMLKAIASKNAVKICEEHGRVNCLECTQKIKPMIEFDHKKLTSEDAIVIDSLSQVGASALNAACLGKPSEYKPTFDDYGACGKWLGDLCTVLQAAAYCHIFGITHTLEITDEGTKKTTIYPLCGTKNFSMNVAKYFGNVIYTDKILKRHNAISTTVGNQQTHAGSRLGLKLDSMQSPDLGVLLTDEKFFSVSKDSVADSVSEPVADKPQEVKPQVKPNFLNRTK